MADVLLLAASGLARETIESIRQTGDHQVVGILDDNPALHGTVLDGVPVLGGLELAASRGEQLLLCMGKSSARAAAAMRLGLDEERYATHVHSSAFLARSTVLGAGSIVLAGCVATADVVLGRHAVLMPHALLTHDNQLGDFATLAAGAALAGRVRAGDRVYIGTNAAVRENLVLGDDAVLGMGSVLLQDLPAGETWAGSPAHKLYGPAGERSAHARVQEVQAR
ncbi:NeuD/PglB/VioB family sugar acetyltransferase [Glutamicibacter nicotianae]|uniref:NeuD/PglB/VioB family sugar acetyltransferase n=1 Tax=Glutamicibacter nicotianae TaxID=37929 RepID=UPI000EF91C32|nr:NeuD/PglB/VioB family sugar acetyltransferase [Glutamicibacter nicotianae]